MNQYLIPANSKRGQLIFSLFRPIDLGIISIGTAITLILFIGFQPNDLLPIIIVLLPFLGCAFLVLPIANYHNMLCVIQNLLNFYFVDQKKFVWRGWCFKDEYKD